MAENPHNRRVTTLDASTTSETDLIIISALQESPRAPWADIAPVLQIGADALAQRWQRLSEAGLAWIAVDEVHPGQRVLTFVLADARGAARADLIKQALADPRIRTVHATTGSKAFCLYLETRSYEETARCIETLESVPGLSGLTVIPVASVVSSGADWRTRALSEGQRVALDALRRPVRPNARPLTNDPVVSALQSELSVDGRASVVDLTRRLTSHYNLAVSESTVARRLGRMLEDPLTRIRCDVSSENLGWQAVTMLWLRIPPDVAETLGHSSLSMRQRLRKELPDVRSFMVTVGTENLHVTAWLHRIEDVPAFETQLINWLGGVGEVVERMLCHATYKRMGFAITDGRRISRATSSLASPDFSSKPPPAAPGRPE